MTLMENTFSQKSDAYASSRPTYPAALYEWIYGRTKGHDIAWDCATGNGQAASALASKFRLVFATDISREQIAHGMIRKNIEYSVQSAESTSFPDQTFDLVVVAQALHWFDFPKFWQELKRVCKPGALFCAWGYDWLTSIPEVDTGLVKPLRDVIDPFWAPNNRILWEGYRDSDISCPFSRVETPRLSIEMNWRLEQLIAYMQTWSAYKRSLSDQGRARELGKLISKVRGAVDPDRILPIQMPLKMVAAYLPE